MLGNNGNQLADMMTDNDLLSDGLTLEQCEQIAIKEGIVCTDQQKRWLKNDDFWEDFCYRIDEIGRIKLKY